MRAGKILYPACRNFAAWQVAHALGVQATHGLSRRWSRCSRCTTSSSGTAEIEILPMAQSLGLAVVPYSPTGGGLLTGKYGVGRAPGARPAARHEDVHDRATPTEGFYEIAERFSALAHELGMRPTTLAVAWVASHPAVTCVLVGGRDVGQLSPSLAAAERRARRRDPRPDLRAVAGAAASNRPQRRDVGTQFRRAMTQYASCIMRFGRGVAR